MNSEEPIQKLLKEAESMPWANAYAHLRNVLESGEYLSKKELVERDRKIKETLDELTEAWDFGEDATMLQATMYKALSTMRNAVLSQISQAKSQEEGVKA
ncbi:MAG: hypothetical protein JRN67_05230 [Nitrososphaerota archaeon]|nr:hypothetical protein [Nitrososphaerota archaeon]